MFAAAKRRTVNSIGGDAITIAVISLALNLVASSLFILAVKRLALAPAEAADGADPIALRAGGRAHTTGASRGASEREAAAQHEPSSGATNSARA